MSLLSLLRGSRCTSINIDSIVILPQISAIISDLFGNVTRGPHLVRCARSATLVRSHLRTGDGASFQDFGGLGRVGIDSRVSPRRQSLRGKP